MESRERVALQASALQNIEKSVDAAVTLPFYVLKGDWGPTLFFESDAMDCDFFVDVIHSLCEAEESEVACMINITERRRSLSLDNSVVFLDASLSKEDYMATLKGQPPALGWYYTVDHFACSSDKGLWCIYIEKDNDVGLIAFRRNENLKRFVNAIQILEAESIDSITASEVKRPPFSMLVPKWRDSLRALYKSND